MNAQAINGALRRVPAWPIYGLGLMHSGWLWYLGVTGGLGPDPVQELEHRLGLVALQILIAVLAVTPIRRYLGINLIRYRRALGLVAFFYVVQHLMVWLVLDIGDLGRMWADILKRPYVTVGFAAFVAMIPLAVTSNNWSVRRLGAARWQSLHKLTYFIVIGGAIHFIWLFKVKNWATEPMLYMAIILVLLALRMVPRSRRVAA